jgi:hypothetical protein
MELLVLAENDAEWYRIRNIRVNSNFPNIEYCETPFYGHLLKPIDSMNSLPKIGATSHIEFHSSSGKLFRTTLVIDKERDSVYRRVEELPASSPYDDTQVGTIPPLRPDGTLRHPGSDALRVYYRRDRQLPTAASTMTGGSSQSGGGVTDELAGSSTIPDSGHGTISNRLSTPNNLNNTFSAYSTLNKSYGDQIDLLHDKWADEMDRYLDTKFQKATKDNQDENDPNNNNKRSHVIKLSEPNMNSTLKRSRCTSPADSQQPNNNAPFSYLYSGRDDLNHQQQPQRGTSLTQSYNRYSSPSAVQSPTRLNNNNNNNTNSRPLSTVINSSRPSSAVAQQQTGRHQSVPVQVQQIGTESML